MSLITWLLHLSRTTWHMHRPRIIRLIYTARSIWLNSFTCHEPTRRIHMLRTTPCVHTARTTWLNHLTRTIVQRRRWSSHITWLLWFDSCVTYLRVTNYRTHSFVIHLPLGMTRSCVMHLAFMTDVRAIRLRRFAWPIHLSRNTVPTTKMTHSSCMTCTAFPGVT